MERAAKNLGLASFHNITARGYAGLSWEKHPLVIRIPQAEDGYDIAVDAQPDGTYGLTTDWYRGGTEKRVGAEFTTLLAEYDHVLAAQAAEAEGLQYYRVGSEADAAKVNNELGLYGEDALSYGGKLLTVIGGYQ